MSIYKSPRLFKLKPNQRQRYGKEKLMSGLLLSAFSLLNFYILTSGDIITLLFALFFGWHGLRQLNRGWKLMHMPEQEHGYRISTQGLYKVIEGEDRARLDLKEIQGIWLNTKKNELFLMTQRGVESIKKIELLESSEWEDLHTWLERSTTETIYRRDRAQWELLKEQSLAMSTWQERNPRGVKLMMIAIFIGLISFVLGATRDHIPFIIQTGVADLLYDALGAPMRATLMRGELTRLFGGLLVPSRELSALFDLAVLYWVARPLERAWGTSRVLFIYFAGYLGGVITMIVMSAQELYIGAHGASLALLVAAYHLNFHRQVTQDASHFIPEPLKSIKNNALLFLVLFILFFSVDHSNVVWMTWLVSIGVGVVLGRASLKQSLRHHWIIPESPARAQVSAIVSAALPTSIVIFAVLSLPISLKDFSTPEQLRARYSPSMLVELAQRCQGAPPSLLINRSQRSPIAELDSYISTPERCSLKIRSAIETALLKIEEETQQKNPLTSLQQQAWRRAQWLNRVSSKPLKKELLSELTTRSSQEPEDLYGSLLTSMLTLLEDQEEPNIQPELSLATRSGPLTLKIDGGKLTWKFEESTSSSNPTQDLKIPLGYWIQVYSAQKKFRALLWIEVSAEVQSNSTRPELNSELIYGVSKSDLDQAQLAIAPLPPPHRTDSTSKRQLRIQQWTSYPEVDAWLSKAWNESLVSSSNHDKD